MLQQVIEVRLGRSALLGKQEAGDAKKIEIDFLGSRVAESRFFMYESKEKELFKLSHPLRVERGE